MASRITSTQSLTSGKWNKSGRPAWWARYTDEDGKEQFAKCFGAEGREILDVACDLPVGTIVKIGCGTAAQIRETVTTTEITAEWQNG
jgi:hypothetical protein